MSDDTENDGLIAAVLARFPGASITYAGPPEKAPKPVPAPGDRIEFHEYFAGFFERADALWRNGWPAFPQSRDSASRAPSPCVAAIAHLRTKLPSKAERREWQFYTPYRGVRSPNAAIVIQDGVFVLDIDVRDGRADAIEALAHEHLGPTPLVRRVAGSLKRALIYRSDSSVAGRRKSAHKLMTEHMELPRDADGKALDDAVELLMPGSVYTVAGAHYKSGQIFRWHQAPWSVGPDAAPVVSNAQIDSFLDAVEATVAPLSQRRGGDRFNVSAATGAVSPATVDASGLVTPGNVQGTEQVTWDGGKVVDGREQYLLKRSYAFVLANPTLAATAGGRAALANALMEECRANWAGVGSKYSAWNGGGSSVLSDARAKVESAQRKALRDPQAVVRLGRDENGRINTAVRTAVAVERGDALKWVVESQVSMKAVDVAEQDRKRRERALQADPAARAAGQQAVSDAVRALGHRFLADVREFLMDPEAETPVRVGRFPTGAGKTSTLVEILGRGVPGPILFLLPSYANIEEVIERHKAGRKAAPDPVGATATFKAAAAEAVNDARRLGLDVQVMTGKEKGGCLMSGHLAMCRAHGANAQALCHKDIKGPGDEKPVRTYCRHHPDNEDRPADVASCPVIEARRKLLSAQVVFAPTAFLTQVLPEGLKKHFKGMIVDERCIFELLRYDHFQASVLLLPRPEPTLTQADREQKVEVQDLLRDRDEIAAMAHKALAAGEDVAAAVLAYSRPVGVVWDRKVLTGPELLDAAIAVAGRAQSLARAIRPNMDLADLEALLTGPRADYLRQEHRFWTLVKERVEWLQADAQAAALNAGVLLTRMAKGDRDVRIQALEPGVISGTKGLTVRISWLSEPTLDSVPTLLLDASADEALTGKAWRGRDVAMTDVDAYLHMQTVACLDAAWGVSSFCPGEGADDDTLERCAKNVRLARNATTNLAALFGQGRIAVFAPMRTRVAVQTGYAESANVDTGHLGAVRGLDFAKLHLCVATIGRHEFPSWIYDALAAACTYDDDEPELPFDRYGNGLDAEGKPIRMPRRPRTYKLRDGRDLTVEVSEMPGVWGHRIQRQFREEELRQAAGRLRPVYRDAVGTWVAVSNVLPEDTVIDAVTSLRDLSEMAGAGAVFEAIRRAGVADPDLIRAQAPDALGKRLPELEMRLLGLLGADLSSPYAAGMDAYVVHVGGEERTVQVPAWHGEHALDEAVEAYDRSDLSVRGIRFVAAGGQKVPSQVKAPDKVDAILGTREERLADERALREAAREFVQPLSTDQIFPQQLAAWNPANVDVARAMILAGQMGCDGAKAARLGGSAPYVRQEEITLPDDGTDSEAGPSERSPLPPARIPGAGPTDAPAASPAGPPTSRLASLRARSARHAE
ncbi:hypothetical protein ASF36_23400 [Methylobacterium sp. Leaf90]|nr:hypothetical protein ASF36_23400 [Methylobacterium sp. Leaf90]